jgi:hypothetical protein
LALQQVGSNLVNTGRGADVVATAVLDPKATWARQQSRTYPAFPIGRGYTQQNGANDPDMCKHLPDWQRDIHLLWQLRSSLSVLTVSYLLENQTLMPCFVDLGASCPRMLGQ